MPKEGDIVTMPDGNTVRYLEMNTKMNVEEDVRSETGNGVQREHEEIDNLEQPEQS